MSHSKHTADVRKPYGGLSRSLVIAIDVGTTFSGVSYAILEPGEIPKIHGVTRFPGQEHVAGNSKIPSVIYYDKYGRVMAAGAEIDNTSVVAQAEDENWIKAELFKLRLRPRTMQLNMNGMRLSPLPKRKTPVHVFGDFLSYMFRCTRSFICDTHANGLSVWNSVESDIQFVLSHPNGWEGPQQTRMRNAAVSGNLVPDTDAGRARIRFVTEGEASLHACVLSGLASEVLQNPSKHGFLIADAGGGTLDISAYAVKGTSPLTIEEIAPPDCIFAGSVFVSRRAREFLEDKLKNSKYGTPDSLDHITRKFDETTKRLFRDRNELQFIPFGSPLDKDPAVGIRSGQLRLTGNEVANLFEPSVDAAVNAIRRQVEASREFIRSVFLVGGYAASPWLFQQLQERLRSFNIVVSRPDTQTSKAVADGAIGFYCDHHVSARMSKFMYGVEFLRELDPHDPEHLVRKEKLCELPSGPKLLPDAFDCILARSVKVKESTVFTRKYCTELTNLSMLSVFEVEIWCFRGGNDIPKWINRQDDKFSTLCVVQADLSLLNGSAEPKIGKNGKKYWTIVFSVEIHFGLTEFKARIKWMDNGQVKYGPAVIVYNERGHRIDDEDLDLYPEDDYPSSRSDRRGGNGHTQVSPRPQTPINPYHPPTGGVGGTSTHRTSTVGAQDGNRGDRSSNKGYAPSIAQSTSARSNADRGAYPGSSDSERKRGKEKEDKYDDRTSIIDRSKSAGGSIYGTPSPLSRGGSMAGDPYSAPWGAGGGGGTMGGMPSSRSPSVRPPNSRSVSFYDGDAPQANTTGTGDHHHHVSPSAGNQTWGAGSGGGGTPKSAVDERRQNHPWDNPPPPPAAAAAPQSAELDAILDRSKSLPQNQFAPEPTSFSDGRPRSPFMHDYSQDRPKSAFGDMPPAVFGHEPAMFGDSGPAAAYPDSAGGGGSTALFGEPPAAVFGETVGVVGGGHNNNISDGWGFSTTPVATSGKKDKKKTSALGTPLSGLASRASPASGPKSAFGDDAGGGVGGGGGAGGLLGSKAPSAYDKGKRLSPLNPASQMNNEYTPGPANDSWGFEAAAPRNTGENFASWGEENLGEPQREPSMVPSPVPSPQHKEPPPVEEQDMVAVSGKKKKKKGSTVTTPAKSPNISAAEEERRKKEEEEERLRKEEEDRRQREEELQRQEAERRQMEEDEQRQREEDKRKGPPPVEEQDMVAVGGKKKKKKGSTPAKSPNIFAAEEEEDRRQREELQRQEAERRQMEEDEQRQREEDKRQQEEEWFREEARVKEEEEKKRQEDEAAAATQRRSLFGNPTSLFAGGIDASSSLSPPVKPWLTAADSGGGDDAWGSSWGISTQSNKKKEKNANSTATDPKPSMFGNSWGFGLGSADPNPESSNTVADITKGVSGLFDFSAPVAPSLGFDFGGGAAAEQSRSSSPPPGVLPTEPAPPTPEEMLSPTAEAGGNAAGGGGGGEAGETMGAVEGGGDDDGGGGGVFEVGKKKKKKGKKGGIEQIDDFYATPHEAPATSSAPDEVPPPAAETVTETAPEAADAGFAPAAGKKKKKKK